MRRDDDWVTLAALGTSQHGAFTRRQAADVGITSRDVRRARSLGLVHEPTPGVLRFAGSPATWHQDLWVATHAGGGFHAYGPSAARLHNVDGYQRTTELHVIGGPTSTPLRQLPDVRRHRSVYLPDDDLVVLEAIPTTGWARTIVDLAHVHGTDAAVRAIDDFERRGSRLGWLRLTAERLHRPGQRGTKIVLRHLDERQTGGRVPDSWFERLVERCVSVPGLPPWSRQHPLRNGAGRLVARLDLACIPLKLGVEAHSKAFHFGPQRSRSDQHRDDEVAALGWDLRYVGWYAAEQPSAVAAMIARVAYRRAEQLGVRLPWVA